MVESLPSFDYGRSAYAHCGQFRTQYLIQLRFYQVLVEYALKNQVKINIPDTIIQGFGVKKPTCIRTNQHGFITIRAGLGSPEYCLPSVIAFLLTLSSQSKPNFPCAIVKLESHSQDTCMPLLTLKAGQIAWNRMLGLQQPVLIQRFVYNGSPCVFVLRVKLQPSLSHVRFSILQNVRGVEGNTGEDHYLELNGFLGQSGGKSLLHPKRLTSVAERLCVRSRLLQTYDFCPISSIESVRNQTETIKTILEKVYLSKLGLSVLELEADFIQGPDAKWYFVSLHSYRTEVTVQRSLPKSKTQELLMRLLPRTSSTPIVQERVLNAETLTAEILEDLRH